MGATVPLAVGRQASDLDRPAPSMSRGISAAHHRRWAAYARSLGIKVQVLGVRVWGLGFEAQGLGFRTSGLQIEHLHAAMLQAGRLI